MSLATNANIYNAKYKTEQSACNLIKFVYSFVVVCIKFKNLTTLNLFYGIMLLNMNGSLLKSIQLNTQMY